MTRREYPDRLIIAAQENVKEKAYWHGQMAGELVFAGLAYDHQPSTVLLKSLEQVGELTFAWEGKVYEDLLKLSKGVDHRLHMILSAGWALLLARYTGLTDIMMGTTIYRQKEEPGTGFINTLLPLRFIIRESMTFKEWLIHVRETIIKANEHQNYPIEVLAEELGLPVDPGAVSWGFPLFQTALLLQGIHEPAYLSGYFPHIIVVMERTPGELRGQVRYSPFYEPVTIKRVLNHFRQLLEHALASPGQLLSCIPVLNQEEEKQLVVDFNQTAVDYPSRLLHEWFEEQVEKTPGAIAIVDGLYQDPANPGKITYGDLNEKANRLAHLLRGKGVTVDSLVAVIIEPSVELAIAILGILKAGGGFLPIEPEYPPRRIAAILENSEVRLVLTREAVARDIGPTILKNVDFNLVPQIVTASRPQIQNFDALPIPDRGLVNYREIHACIGCAMARHTVSIQGSRGCPFNCAYCHKIWPKSHIVRSAENIFNEIMTCYRAGARRFTFIDDVFNLDKKNSTQLLQMLIDHRLDVQLFFPNGLRGDILTRETIDLMVEAGTVDMALALESGSPRIQKLIGKNLNLEKFKENVRYITENYPQVILELEIIIGFPSETEEDVMMTFQFLQGLKWVHFPNLHILKIYRNTDMYRLAIENGVTPEQIDRSSALAYHHLPDTLPFSKSFARQFQARVMNEYILNKERLKALLPYQVKILTESELLEKYNTYLPMEIRTMEDLLKAADISRDEIELEPIAGDPWAVPRFVENIREQQGPGQNPDTDAFRILLMDLSQLFIEETGGMLYDVIEEPLGLMYLMTDLMHTYGSRIHGKVIKSRVDFKSLEELRGMIEEFNPHLIGIRTLTYYKEFFHRTVSVIRQSGIHVPIIAGGPYATSDYNFVLMDQQVDLAVIGEGEETLRELVGQMMAHDYVLPPVEELKKVRGIAFLEPGQRQSLKEINRELLFLDHLPHLLGAYSPENPSLVNSPRDLLYMISTSGSTGKPKGIMIEHRTLSNLMYYQFRQTPIDFSGHVLQFASIAFDISPQEVFSTLLSGGCLYPMPGDLLGDMPRFFEFLQENQISVVFLPPAFLKFIFSDPAYAQLFPGQIRDIIAAGEQLIVIEPFRHYLEKYQVRLHNHYGPAETHVVTTLTLDTTTGIPGFPAIGRPIANTYIVILDPHFSLAPLQVAGEIWIGGVQVGRGYLNNPELTDEKFVPVVRIPSLADVSNPVLSAYRQLYRTGDLGRWLENGTIEFLGRIDFQVKIRGFRIELGEIEQHLRSFPGIKEVVVIDVKDPGGERSLCAYIVSEVNLDMTQVKDFLVVQVPDFMVPAYFVQVERIPLNANGKVDRASLPVPQLKSDKDDYVAPENRIQETLQEIWSEVLGVNRRVISIDDNFFELGGHSLKATVMIARVHKQLNVKIPLGEIFKMPTIRGLSQYIGSARTEFHLAIMPVEEREYYPVSSAQKRMYIINHLKLGNTSDNTPDVVVINGPLDPVRLQIVVDKLIQRHEVLRTSFQLVADEPVQWVHGVEQVKFLFEWIEREVVQEGEVFPREQVDEMVRDFIRPFDLGQAPLLRVRVVKLAVEKYILMYDMHHIIKDGTSSGIFMQEFVDLYLGLPLQRPRLQYRDFTIWQQQLFRSGVMKKQEEYWLKVFSGEIPRLSLPTDFERPRVQDFSGDSIGYYYEKELSARLEEMAARTGTTLYMILLAIYNILLSKYSSQEDIIVGTPAAGRPHEDLQGMIGMFVNTLAMRNRPERGKTFMQFLNEVKENSLQAFENQDFQFEELVSRLGIEPDPSRQSLFDTMFAVHDISFIKGRPARKIKKLSFAPFPIENKISQFDIITHVVPVEYNLTFLTHYCTKLFKRETIEGLISSMREITLIVVNNPQVLIQDIAISHQLTAADDTVPQMDFNF